MPIDTALLIPIKDAISGRQSWQWMTPSGEVLSPVFDIHSQALENKPVGYNIILDGGIVTYGGEYNAN